MQEKNIQGHLVAGLVVIIWGTTFVNSKVLLNRGISPDEIFLYGMLTILPVSVTLIVASIVLGETITPMAVGGVILLILGMVLAQRKQRLQT